MPCYQLIREQTLGTSPEALWDFLSSPINLTEITPGDMGFEITSPDADQPMYAGMIISYRIRMFQWLRMNWVTEITHVELGKYFVDEQRLGPYAMWHHQHKITAVDGGVKMIDIITYRPPLGAFGALINSLFLNSKLKSIFDHRFRVFEERFGSVGA